MKGSSKKGSTLLELCIVMALISILLAIIGSFAVSVNGFTAAAKKKNDVTQDYLLCKKYIENLDKNATAMLINFIIEKI